MARELYQEALTKLFASGVVTRVNSSGCQSTLANLFGLSLFRMVLLLQEWETTFVSLILRLDKEYPA
jgi:hypothetical protein